MMLHIYRKYLKAPSVPWTISMAFLASRINVRYLAYRTYVCLSRTVLHFLCVQWHPLMASLSTKSHHPLAFSSDLFSKAHGSAPDPVPELSVSESEDPFLDIKYNCTLCWGSFSRPSYIVGNESRIVCIGCWRWMYGVNLCTACGETVYQKTDAINFGCRWWHWGCSSCLVCRVRLSFHKH